MAPGRPLFWVALLFSGAQVSGSFSLQESDLSEESDSVEQRVHVKLGQWLIDAAHTRLLLEFEVPADSPPSVWINGVEVAVTLDGAPPSDLSSPVFLQITNTSRTSWFDTELHALKLQAAGNTSALTELLEEWRAHEASVEIQKQIDQQIHMRLQASHVQPAIVPAKVATDAKSISTLSKPSQLSTSSHPTTANSLAYPLSGDDVEALRKQRAFFASASVGSNAEAIDRVSIPPQVIHLKVPGDFIPDVSAVQKTALGGDRWAVVLPLRKAADQGSMPPLKTGPWQQIPEASDPNGLDVGGTVTLLLKPVSQELPVPDNHTKDIPQLSTTTTTTTSKQLKPARVSDVLNWLKGGLSKEEGPSSVPLDDWPTPTLDSDGGQTQLDAQKPDAGKVENTPLDDWPTPDVPAPKPQRKVDWLNWHPMSADAAVAAVSAAASDSQSHPQPPQPPQGSQDVSATPSTTMSGMSANPPPTPPVQKSKQDWLAWRPMDADAAVATVTGEASVSPGGPPMLNKAHNKALLGKSSPIKVQAVTSEEQPEAKISDEASTSPIPTSKPKSKDEWLSWQPMNADDVVASVENAATTSTLGNEPSPPVASASAQPLQASSPVASASAQPLQASSPVASASAQPLQAVSVEVPQKVQVATLLKAPTQSESASQAAQNQPSPSVPAAAQKQSKSSPTSLVPKRDSADVARLTPISPTSLPQAQLAERPPLNSAAPSPAKKIKAPATEQFAERLQRLGLEGPDQSTIEEPSVALRGTQTGSQDLAAVNNIIADLKTPSPPSETDLVVKEIPVSSVLTTAQTTPPKAIEDNVNPTVYPAPTTQKKVDWFAWRPPDSSAAVSNVLNSLNLHGNQAAETPLVSGASTATKNTPSDAVPALVPPEVSAPHPVPSSKNFANTVQKLTPQPMNSALGTTPLDKETSAVTVNTPSVPTWAVFPPGGTEVSRPSLTPPSESFVNAGAASPDLKLSAQPMSSASGRESGVTSVLPSASQTFVAQSAVGADAQSAVNWKNVPGTWAPMSNPVDATPVVTAPATMPSNIPASQESIVGSSTSASSTPASIPVSSSMNDPSGLSDLAKVDPNSYSIVKALLSKRNAGKIPLPAEQPPDAPLPSLNNADSGLEPSTHAANWKLAQDNWVPSSAVASTSSEVAAPSVYPDLGMKPPPLTEAISASMGQPDLSPLVHTAPSLGLPMAEPQVMGSLGLPMAEPQVIGNKDSDEKAVHGLLEQVARLTGKSIHRHVPEKTSASDESQEETSHVTGRWGDIVEGDAGMRILNAAESLR